MVHSASQLRSISAPSDAEVRRTRAILIISIVVTVALYAIPYGRYVAYPLMLLSTLAHEMGHGIAALVAGAEFHSFKMWPNGSGVAMTTAHANGRLAAAFTSAGGLVGPSLVAAIFFGLGRNPRLSRITLLVMGFLLLLLEVAVVRNPFGWLFLFTAAKAPAWISQVSLVFVAVQLALSVFSRGDYLFMKEAETAQGKMPSDVSVMAEALFLPYWFWGALCGVFSIAVLVLGLLFFLRGVGQKSRMAH
jgi:hypothetical protein